MASLLEQERDYYQPITETLMIAMVMMMMTLMMITMIFMVIIIIIYYRYHHHHCWIRHGSVFCVLPSS